MTNVFTDIAGTHVPEIAGSSSSLRRIYPTFGKRVLDLLLAFVMLPALAPVIGLLYFMVRLEGGPGFFGHTRIGRNGRSFRCWKLRTMSPQADVLLEQLLRTDPAARAEWERDRKLRQDPRVTRLGKFLRRSSLDELPQIWNVLKGEMSLIGPRPVTRDELVKYGSNEQAYLSTRPGITGAWQVSGRNDISYAERVRLDTRYSSQLSLMTDVRILARTVRTVARGTGC